MTGFQRWAACIVILASAVLPAAPSSARLSLVHLAYKGPAQIEALRARGVEIVAFTKNGFDIVVDDDQLASVRALGYTVKILQTDGAPAIAALDDSLGLYHTYGEMVDTLTTLAAAYPAIAQLSTIGTSIEGRNIYLLKISDNVGADETEPEVLYMGNHHARELMSVEIPLRFARHLLENYGIDPDVTDHVDNREIFFIPMVNPDGHVYVEQNHGGWWGSWWRKNRRLNGNTTYGVDLNRNYGFEWGFDNLGSSPTPGSDLYRGTGPFSEPEVVAVRDFVNTRDITIWFSYHSYGELLLYPWGYEASFAPDHCALATLADTLVAENGYTPGNYALGTIYATNGDSDDWGYGEQVSKDKIFAYTPEVNTSGQGGFGPSDALIGPTFDLLLPMNLKALEYADNPYRVLGPERPTMYAPQSPLANAVTALSWSTTTDDPNPAVSYDVEVCRDPTFVADTGTTASPFWNLKGFMDGVPGHSGDGYASGAGNSIFHTMTAVRPILVAPASDTLRMWVTYDIEANYDYAYVEASTDGGKMWDPIAGNVTTNYDPFGSNRGNGITGNSGGWVEAIFPLTGFLGSEINMRVSYVTDGALINPGITVDEIHPITDCADVMTIASADTLWTHYPGDLGEYNYRVQGIDDDGQRSPWSTGVQMTIATTSAAGDRPRYQTALGVNHPNPFNPSTRIPFVVGGEALVRVTLAIYAVDGAHVATLVSDVLRPGPYSKRWIGTGQDGRSMPSGVYFSRLIVGTETPVTRKLVLLK